jgi:hypothetical protein
MGWGGQRHAPATLPPEKNPGTQCREGWVGPMAGLDDYREKKISFPHLGSNPVCPARGQSTYQLLRPDPRVLC